MIPHDVFRDQPVLWTAVLRSDPEAIDRPAALRQGRRMRIGAAGAAVALGVLAGCGSGGDGTSAASCTGPHVTVTPAEAVVGQDVTATVEWLRSGCDDTGGADEERPLVDVAISFVQGGTSVLLDEVSGAGERYSATLVFPVPAEAVPGPAGQSVVGFGDLPATLTVLP